MLVRAPDAPQLESPEAVHPMERLLDCRPEGQSPDHENHENL